MIKQGWLPRQRDPRAQLEAVLRFFGVSSMERWAALWDGGQVAYRRSQRLAAHPEALFAWLRQGEIEAQRIDCGPYDRGRFRALLDALRGLTREPPEVFQARLTAGCAAVGVAVVLVPELPKTRVSGATRWLTPGKALIQLSRRYKSDDQLWFTFFHEAAHVLLHGKRDLFIEDLDANGATGDNPNDIPREINEGEIKEQEANRFAADLLIPPADLSRLLVGGRPTLAQVETFALAIGIAPGIVVGRLQREGVYPHSVGNQLKRRLSASPPSAE